MSEASANELAGPDASQKLPQPRLTDGIEMDSGLPADHCGQPLSLHSSIRSNQPQ